MERGHPERQTVYIRAVDVETWARIRSEAVRRRWTTAAVLEHVVREWAACQERATAARS